MRHIKNGDTYDAANPQNMDINETADECIERVSRALAEIAEGEKTTLREEVRNDPREIVEHIISIKEAISELNRPCPEETVVMEDLMSVRPRGGMQHLGSRVTGYLDEKKDFWDAFDVLFPSITASGIPRAPALEGIQRLESQPREPYSGAALLIDSKRSFEATVVLQTVLQDKNRRWV
ncbi:hypothetical protein AWENTII_008257 [Aspergillus wentii]